MVVDNVIVESTHLSISSLLRFHTDNSANLAQASSGLVKGRMF